MVLSISSRSIDAGIVARDIDAMIAFYRDLLGLETADVLDMPGGGRMHRLRAGDSLVKILDLGSHPSQRAASGSISAASGLRYLTIHVSNLKQATAEIEAAQKGPCGCAVSAAATT